MDETTILKDILTRLDGLTKYIVEIRSDMILRDEYRADKDLIYQKIMGVQVDMAKAMKDSLEIVSAQVVSLDGRLKSHDSAIGVLHTTVTKPRLPSWVIAAATAIVTLISTQAVELAEKTFYVHR